MRLEAPASDDPRDVLRAVRAAVLGAGPAVGLGGGPAGRGMPPAEVPPGTAAVVTTSGSTGVPKSVALGRNALIASALATEQRLGRGAWLLALPATYIAGVQVLVRAVIAGHEPAILSGPFRPEAFAAAARLMASASGDGPVPAFTSLVPAQLQRLLDAAERDPAVAAAVRSFDAVLIGGQALPSPLRDRALAAGARIVRTYGATETSGGCVYDGVPLPGVSVRVVEGEVQLSGPTLADGYLDEPERTAAAFPRDADGRRWYRTGDAGAVEDGVLRVTGRLDDVIVSGGVNVSLDRVERVVRGIPSLSAAVVVGVEDARWGEASVVAVARAGAPDPDGLLAVVRAAVAAELGAPARPSRVLVLDELPLLPSGKPDRRALRRLAAS